jgi:hypothetical protein
MATHWGPPTRVGPPRAGRLARAGTVALAGFVVWMMAGRAMLGSASSRPPLILVGWTMLRDALEMHGHALGAFRLALGGLWVALPLWAISAGFRRGPGWLSLAGLVIGLGGLLLAVPLLVAVAIVAANAALWGLGIMVGLLLLAALLLRAVTAPFRRW